MKLLKKIANQFAELKIFAITNFQVGQLLFLF